MQALRRDVRERPGHVSDRRQRVRVLQLRKPEVEEPHRYVLLLGDQHVRGLHIAVHDPARVGEGEPLEDLRRGLDGALVVQVAGAQSLTQRAPRDVLVRDVEMLVVCLEAVRAQAVRMVEARCGRRFPLRARARAAFLGDDLERDVAAGLLVPRQPHRPRAAASERAQGPVSAEHEAVRRHGFDGACHRGPLGSDRPKSCSDRATRYSDPLRTVMSENDIEFDFFEEPDTRETAEERPRRRGQRPPVRPPTGLTPLLRLIGLISFAILIVLLLVLWVNGCREDKRKDAYRNYVTTVRDYANQSQRLGRQFNTLLTSTGKKESDVESELAGLAGQQDQITNNARNLDPPGHLRDQDSHMLEAFELRSNGLRAMSDAFRSTASSKNADAAGSDLAVQMRRFIASDVLWQDFFKEPTKEELDKIGVTGVNVPDSLFLRNPDIATSASMKAVWQRVHGAATGGATCTPRGTQLVSTTVLPAGKELSESSTNTIQQSTDLAFQVKVKNSGCAQEVGLRVTLTIQQSPKPIKSRKTIPLIDSGAEESVEFRNLPLPPLDQKTSVTVEVDPVPSETTTDNNSASYPVQFSFG